MLRSQGGPPTLPSLPSSTASLRELSDLGGDALPSSSLATTNGVGNAEFLAASIFVGS